MSEQAVNTEVVAPTPEQAEQETASALSAGYNKVRGEVETAKVEPEANEVKTEEKQDEIQEPAKEEAAKAADPWEGVPPIVKQEFDRLRVTANQVGPAQRHIKVLEDQIAELKAAGEAAKAAAPNAKAKEQVQIQAGEKWKMLKDDLSDIAEGVEEYVAAQAASSQAPVDVEKLRKEWQEGTQGAIDVAEERAFVRFKYPAWKQTVNTDAFIDYSVSGGPSAQEYLYAKSLEKTEPQKAAQLHAGFQERFPQWYEDRGALLYSNLADDAVKLLDGFSEHQKTAAAKAAADAKNKQRLAAATPPRQAASGGPTILPDEAGLAVGYNRIARKRA